jgi:hypothetical protein
MESISKNKFMLCGEYLMYLSTDNINKYANFRLCIQIPLAGGRVFETGDEEFLKFADQGK